MKKNFKMILFIFLVFLFLLIIFSFFYFPPEAKKITWGVNFSQKHTQNLGLDWKETYLAVLDDLKVRNLKIATYWDLIEKEKGKYDFKDLDWQIKEAEKKGAKLLLVIGMKVPRWPECHIPGWARNLDKKEQQKRILNLLEKIILRYKNSPSIWAWQIENEPFFLFGECPWRDEKFLKREINLVKSLDPERKILISASGEWSFWIREAKLGDLLGITMYEIAWFPQFKTYIRYWFPPMFYWLKTKIINRIFNKRVIVIELQAEPWGPVLLYNLPLEEQKKTMDFWQFQKNINFAKKTGLDEFYLWGAEWWFWLKEKQNQPEIWDEAKKLF